MSGVLLVLVSADITRLLLWNFFLKRPTKVDMLEQMLIKSVLHAKKQSPATPLSRVISIFRSKHLEAVNRLYIQFEAQVNFRPAEDSFIDNGIRPAALMNSSSAKYFNLLTFLKTLCMEVIFITLQANNWIQISSLLGIQATYTVYLAYCLFKSKIFSNRFYAASLAIHESCLLAFYSLVAAMESRGASIYKLEGNSSALQQWVVASLAFAALTGVVLLLVTQLVAVIRKCKGTRSKSEAKEESENTKLLQDISFKLQKDGYLEKLIFKKPPPAPTPQEDLLNSTNKELLENKQPDVLPSMKLSVDEKRQKVRLPKVPHHLRRQTLMNPSVSKVDDIRNQ